MTASDRRSARAGNSTVLSSGLVGSRGRRRESAACWSKPEGIGPPAGPTGQSQGPGLLVVGHTQDVEQHFLAMLDGRRLRSVPPARCRPLASPSWSARTAYTADTIDPATRARTTAAASPATAGFRRHPLHRPPARPDRPGRDRLARQPPAPGRRPAPRPSRTAGPGPSPGTSGRSSPGPRSAAGFSRGGGAGSCSSTCRSVCGDVLAP